MATNSDEENEILEEEERDTLPDLYDTLDTPDALSASEGRWTPSTSEGRSVTSEERSLTPETETEDLDEFREMPKPKVIVFDLDYTLWPFWVDRQINIELPFKQVGENKVCDATGREVKSFPDITPLLQRLHSEGYKLGIASEAFYKEEVAKLVKLFGWEEFIDYQEIYPGSKIFHFVKIKRQSGVDFPDMIYFDDEKEHLSEVAGTCTGITTVWADRGVSEELVEEAFQTFAENRQSNTYFRSKPVTISRRNSTEPFVSLRPLINLRRRNSIENDIMLPPPNSVLGGAGLSSLSGSNLPGLSGSTLPGLGGSTLPGLGGSGIPGLPNGLPPGLPTTFPTGSGGGGGKGRQRRRFSIM